jgi:hypothetical protein
MRASVSSRVITVMFVSLSPPNPADDENQGLTAQDAKALNGDSALRVRCGSQLLRR